jgi:preprotein translocase subunit SecE
VGKQAPANSGGKQVETREEKPRVSPFVFLQQVRQEVSKVTWPTRRETVITTVMVFIMVLISALFFFVVDQAINLIVRFLLGLGS